MTTQIKAGDKVRFKDTSYDQHYRAMHWPRSTKETIFTVARVDGGGSPCAHFGICLGAYYDGGAYLKRLELVTETDPKALKVGDVVRFKDTSDDQFMRSRVYPNTTSESVFVVTEADGTYLKLDGRRYAHYRRRFDLVKAAPEPVILGARPEKIILDEAKPAPKAVPLQSHIVVLKTATGLRPASKPFVHVTKKFAEDEAERLAKENPGQTFVVFTSDNEVVSSEPVVTVTKHAVA